MKPLHRRSCLAWTVRLLGGLAALVFVLLLAGYVYQRLTTAADLRQYPAPGHRVDVGGYSLHLYCTGEGSPIVVVEAGNGDFSLGWQGIQPEVAKTTRICTYDRAGYGWSDTSPRPRTAETFAAELHTLLTNAGEAPPYLLVGHSLGGYSARMFASHYPREVAGVILVDAASEKQASRLPAEYAALDQQQMTSFTVFDIMARFGILRLIGSASKGKNFTPAAVLKMPAEIQPIYMAMMSHPGYFDATLAELKAIKEDQSQVMASGLLGDTPLVVLTAGQSLDPSTLTASGFKGEMDFEKTQSEWLALQKDLAAQSTHSRHMIVEGSSHTIQLDRPDVVIEAIRELVEEVKS